MWTDGQAEGRTEKQTDMQTDRSSNMTKIIVDFRNFANGPNILTHFDCL